MTQRGWVDSQPHLQFTRPHQEVDKSEETCSRRQEFSGLGLPRCFVPAAQCTLPLLSSPFYLSSAPAVPTSAAEDSSVTVRLSSLPHEEKSCNSSAMCRRPQGPATSSFSAWLFAVADSAHCASLWFFLHHCLFVRLMALQAITSEGQGREAWGHRAQFRAHGLQS